MYMRPPNLMQPGGKPASYQPNVYSMPPGHHPNSHLSMMQLPYHSPYHPAAHQMPGAHPQSNPAESQYHHPNQQPGNQFGSPYGPHSSYRHPSPYDANKFNSPNGKDDEILDELATHNNLDRDKLTEIRVLNDNKFSTKHAIVNYSDDLDEQLAQVNKLKLGFKMVRFNVMHKRCNNCGGHKHKAFSKVNNENGKLEYKLTCTNKPKCLWCGSDDHAISKCEEKKKKNNNSKKYCVQCKTNGHNIFDNKCRSL